MKQIARLVAVVLPAVIMIGCTSGGDVKEDDTGEAVTTRSATPVPPPDTSTATDLETTDSGQMEKAMEEAATDEPDLLAERKIYFDYDKSEIKPEFRDIVQAHAEYLSKNPDISIVIEGHCDERGTREYNLALGERRAYAVYQMLTLQGVSKSQLKTVSYGEERPAKEGHDESAWQWNRRAVFVYQ